MIKQISIQTKFGWISAFEQNNKICKVKFGKTKSYGVIAKKYKLSPRHVGKICAQNKIPLPIPYHRVIRSDGNLGGFSARGRIALKKKLLGFEKN